MISKPSSKAIKLGKKSKGGSLHQFPLLAALSNPLLNLETLEDLKDEVVGRDADQDHDLPRGVT